MCRDRRVAATKIVMMPRSTSADTVFRGCHREMCDVNLALAGRM
jgi:hypothetical protein